MLLKKPSSIMECALVLLALLDLSCLVFANQGEPGSNPEEGPPSILLKPSVTSNLYPATTATFSGTVNLVKSAATKLTKVPALSGTQITTQTLDIIKAESHSTSFAPPKSLPVSDTSSVAIAPKLTSSESLSAVQTPNLIQSQADTTSTAYPSISSVTGSTRVIQSANVMQSKAASISTTSARTQTSSKSPIATQTYNMMQSQAPATSSEFMSVPAVVSASLLPVSVAKSVSHSLSTSMPDVMQSHIYTTSTAHGSISKSDALLSSLEVSPEHSTVVLSHSLSMSEPGDTIQSQMYRKSTAHASVSENISLALSSEVLLPIASTVVMNSSVSPQESPSAQVPVSTSHMRVGSSTVHLSPSESFDVVTMTTKSSPSSSTLVNLLPSTSSVIVTPPSVTSPGVTSHDTSHLLTSSMVRLDVYISSSQVRIQSTSVSVSTVQTSWQQSSSIAVQPPGPSPPGIPDPPVIRETNVLSAHRVLLKWNATRTQSITNFTVELSVDSVWWEQATCNESLVQGACIVSHMEATFTRLKPYTNYTFRVAARGLFGKSNYSIESKWVVTDEAAPSGSPNITAAYNLSSHEIFVAWQPLPPEILNGRLRNYQIRVKEVNIQPTTSPTSKIILSTVTPSSSSLATSTPVPTTPSGSGYSVTEPLEPPTEGERREKRQAGLPVLDAGLAVSFRIGQLNKWTYYEVSVRAVTVAPGPFSNKVTVRTDEDVPSQPTQVAARAINSTAIFVNWTKPVEMNGLLVKYQVTYSEKDSSKPAVTRYVGHVESVVLFSLNPFTLYVINVSAFTSKGEGNHSTVQVRTDEGWPSPPNNLSTQSLNSTAILVSWDAPTNPNGKINYRLSFLRGSEPKASFKLVYDGDLTHHLVSNLNPFTLYNFKVNAYNVKYNLSSSSVFAMETTDQAAPSGPPQNLRAITNSSSSIILYWMPPKADEQNGEITRYDIHIGSSAPEQAIHVTTTTNATTFAVTDLQAYTNYSFMVRAVNAGGIGPYSSAVANNTFEAEPSPPRNVTAKSVNSTAVKVTWVQPLHPNGVIRYKLYMQPRKDDESVNRPVYEGPGTTYVVSGLQEYVTYIFAVVAFNIKYSWTSPQVVAMETTHPAEPSGSPQDVHALTRSSTSIQVKWKPPLPSERNGLILRYTVQYTPESGKSNSVNTTDNSTSIVVEDLAIFMKYAFSVKAWNVVGAGPESEPVYNKTFEDRPSPPTDVTTKTINSSAIKVIWQTPLNPNGEIYYRLYYWQSSEGSGTRKLAYDGPLKEYTVAGFHEYVTYTFMVQAYNVRYSWSSSAVNVSETTHPAEPSGPPQDVKALTKSSTSILVKWRPPHDLDRNGIITHYIVKYNVSRGTETNISTPDNSTQILVRPLTKYASYYFTVQAVNKIGVGPPSVAVVNSTFEDLPGQPNITSVNSKPDSLELMWTPPVEANGVIKTYQLCWSHKFSNQQCHLLNGATRSYEIPNLQPFSQYTVSLTASTSVGRGPSFNANYTTNEGVPSKPQDLRAWNTSGLSIFVTWKKPVDVNGVLKGYKVFYRPTISSDPPSTKDVGLDNKTTLSELTPYTMYGVTVQAFTGAGGGDTSVVKVMTDETAPSVVVSLIIERKTSQSIELSWRAPSKLNGRIGYYLYYWKKTSDSSTGGSFVLGGQTMRKIVGDLKPFTEYTFSVFAYNLRKNLSGPESAVSAMTDSAAPNDAPRNVYINSTTSTSITLSWDPPLEPNGGIEGYDVMYYEPKNRDKKNINDNVKERVHTIKDLEPWRLYTIQVACQSSGGLGPFSKAVEKRTDAGAPPPLEPIAPPDKETIKSSSFSVVLAKASNERGDVGYYQVIVIELATDNRNEPVPAQDPDNYKAEDLYTYDQARKKKPKLVPYIAAQFSASDFDNYKFFVVGDGKRTSAVTNDVSSRRRRRRSTTEFYNGPLQENTFYAVFQRAYVNKDVYTSSSWLKPVETAAAVRPTNKSTTPTNIGLIVGLVLVIVIVSVLILVGIIFIRRKRLNSDRSLDDREDYLNGQPMRMRKMSRKRRSLQKRLMGSTESLQGLDDLAASRARRQPVPIDDFERHVDRMHMDGDHGFSEEYTLVQPDEEFSFQQFLNPANKYKNRYANIVAYDHTRVLLNPIEGVAGSDYMNANFIDGYNRQRAYIAAQGPLMETFDDFWRMMWEQMSSVIVMLTKLEERGRRKCDHYWPERGTKSYGPIQVTLKETLNMSHYTVRKFLMTHKQYPDDDRNIKQFHFTAWPDHGVPSHPTPLLSLVRHTSSANREAVGPMVVHCSAGVGRTGTFITLDVMLQRISQEDSVDVFGFVRQMRYQRNFMVQTEAQYVFIHDALLEAITCGVTEVEAKDLGARIRELRQFDPETGYTYLENEFCRLAKEENHPIAFKSASLNCNAAKNRYANILPFESTRVHLKMRPGEMGSDYINANFIDGYCQPRAYVATQAPVPDTFEDFWRLIWEQESATVVMLTREEEAGKVKCHHYWPSEGSRLYGDILVELSEETTFSDYISRKFKLTHTEEKESRTVCQFQYTDWPDTGLPDSGVGIVDLIGQVQKWQQQSGNTVIVIHCSGGVGRTGVFCGISMMIERVKAEGVIDVFQTVQAMRLQRPAMVQTAEQYEFCYTTLQEYLDSFDLYANFQ